MSIGSIKLFSQGQPMDSPPVPLVRQDMTGGQNTRKQAASIAENQAVALTNIDLNIIGERRKRRGSILIGADQGAASILRMGNFTIQGETDQLLAYENTSLTKWTGSGNQVDLKTDFVAPSDESKVAMVMGKESGLTPDDVAFVYVDGNNWFRIDTDGNEQDLGSTAGTGSDSPPTSAVGAWYGNRFWILKNDLLYFSDAYDDDYSNCFDTVSNAYRVPVGEERGIAVTRDLGMLIMGENAIWALAPSATPVATDKPQPITTSMGVVSNQAWCAVADDIYFFAQDGLRSAKRTQQDKLQMGASYPVSYQLKTRFDAINWAYKSRIAMVYYDNKILIAVPTGAATMDIWCYYPALDSFTVFEDLAPRCWSKYKVDGKEKLYYGKHGDGKVYEFLGGAFTDEGTTTTNGTTISCTETSREEDFGNPFESKAGGEIEIEMSNIADDTAVNVYAAVDGGTFSLLGTQDLQSPNAPTLPLTLPFYLADSDIVRGKFHLDSLGKFRTLQYRLTHTSANTEDIRTLKVHLLTYKEEYESE